MKSAGRLLAGLSRAPWSCILREGRSVHAGKVRLKRRRKENAKWLEESPLAFRGGRKGPCSCLSLWLLAKVRVCLRPYIGASYPAVRDTKASI